MMSSLIMKWCYNLAYFPCQILKYVGNYIWPCATWFVDLILPMSSEVWGFQFLSQFISQIFSQKHFWGLFRPQSIRPLGWPVMTYLHCAIQTRMIYYFSESDKDSQCDGYPSLSTWQALDAPWVHRLDMSMRVFLSKKTLSEYRQHYHTREKSNHMINDNFIPGRMIDLVNP